MYWLRQLKHHTEILFSRCLVLAVFGLLATISFGLEQVTTDQDTRQSVGPTSSQASQGIPSFKIPWHPATNKSATELLDSEHDSSSRRDSADSFSPAIASTATSSFSPKWNWKASTLQTFEFTMFSHAWRVAWDPGLRYQLGHKPFFHDWFVSYSGYDLDRWSDGDDFVVDYVGHPLQGAVTSRQFLLNYPRSFHPISKDRDYWIPWAQSLIWSAAWQVQWKVGPLSETSIGNAGGLYYVNNCGTSASCRNNPKYSKPTNNTGLTDWVSTPLIGGVWVLAEDALDRYVVAPVARNHRILGGRALRACLEPSRDFAALFAGKFVWQLPQPEKNYFLTRHPKPLKVEDPNKKALPHYETGLQYTNISLPVFKPGCARGCREYLNAAGFNFTYDVNRLIAFDSAVDLIPSQAGSKGMTEGLFGIKLGDHWRHWGLFGKVRPGFIHYNEAWPGGGATTPTSLTRFVWDFGGVVEVYPSLKSLLRFDVGTTFVRYLADYPDPRTSQVGSLLSTQYYTNQSNFQLSTSYSYRF